MEHLVPVWSLVMHKAVTALLGLLIAGQAVLFHFHVKDDVAKAETLNSVISELRSLVDTQNSTLSTFAERLDQTEKAVSSTNAALNARMDGFAAEGRSAVKDAVDGHLLALGQRMYQLVNEGRVTLKSEAETQLQALVGQTVVRLQSTILERVFARRVSVVDPQGRDRIVLETGISQFNGAPNTSIKLTSPASLNPIILSTTDAVASVSVSKRAILTGMDSGEAHLALFKREYAQNGIANVALSTTANMSRFAISDDRGSPAIVAGNAPDGSSVIGTLSGPGRFRSLQGISPQGVAYSAILGPAGEVMYSVEAGADPYPSSFLKTHPLKQLWSSYKEANSILKLISTLFQ